MDDRTLGHRDEATDERATVFSDFVPSSLCSTTTHFRHFPSAELLQRLIAVDEERGTEECVRNAHTSIGPTGVFAATNPDLSRAHFKNAESSLLPERVPADSGWSLTGQVVNIDHVSWQGFSLLPLSSSLYFFASPALR